MGDRKRPANAGSDSRGAAHEHEHEHEETVRKGYEAAREPERQGDGDPGPVRTAEQPAETDRAE